jgi:hypothetical protein
MPLLFLWKALALALSGSIHGPSDERGGEPADESRRSSRLHSCDLEVSWENDMRLSIQYRGDQCNIRLFKNWCDPESVKVQQPVRIEIVLEE